MGSNTNNHEFYKPAKGEKGWGSKKNADWDNLETDVPLRDDEANLNQYEPVDGARFIATDTGAVYDGDGINWRLAERSVKSLDADEATTTQSQTWGRTSVSSDTTTDGTSIYWHVDTEVAGSSVTLTIDSSDAVEGRELNVKRDGPNNVTIDTEGSETIDGSDSITLTQDQESVTLVFNNPDADWEIW